MPWDQTAAASLGQRIRERRGKQGLSQEELAHRAGVTKNHLGLLEAGRSSVRTDNRYANPRIATLVGIAEAMSLPVEELLGQG